MLILNLDGYIGGYNADPYYVRSLIENSTEQEVIVNVTSSGGSYFKGLEIHNYLRNSGRKITTRVNTLAMSAGAIIAIAGDTCEMAENAILMFHPVKMETNGEALSPEELLEKADILNKCKESLIKTIQAKCGKDEKYVSYILSKESWYTAEEAKEEGLIDNIIPITRRNKDISNVATVPEAIVAHVRNKEGSTMSLKDIVAKFDLKVEDGKEEEGIINFIDTLKNSKKVEQLKVQLPKAIVSIVAKARTSEIDSLVTSGKIVPAVATKLKERFVAEDKISSNSDENGEIKDDFDIVIVALSKNDEVISFSAKSGVQPSPNPGIESNPLVSDMESRSKKG